MPNGKERMPAAWLCLGVKNVPQVNMLFLCALHTLPSLLTGTLNPGPSCPPPGLVKDSIDPQFADDFLFDVYEEDVPRGFLALPDRRQRKQAALHVDPGLEEIRDEKRRRAAALRRAQEPKKTKKQHMLTNGIDFKSHELSWDELYRLAGIKPGPDDSKVKIAVFHRPLVASAALEPLGTCSLSALDLLGRSKRNSRIMTGSLIHLDPNVMSGGQVRVSMTFETADKCLLLQPQQDKSQCGTWHMHKTAGHPPNAFGPARSAEAVEKTRAFAQVNLLESLPWTQVAHESEWKVRVSAWDKTHTRKIVLKEGTGIHHSCSPVAVSQMLRDQARLPRLLAYYIEMEQHDLAQATLRAIRRKKVPLDSRVAAVVDRYEAQVGCQDLSPAPSPCDDFSFECDT